MYFWGDFNKFATSSHDAYCSSKPAGISWGSSLRGDYCPVKDTGQVAKYTWYSDKSKERHSTCVGEAAQSLTSLSPGSKQIFGISTKGKLLTLFQYGDTVLTVPILPKLLGDQNVVAIGGIGRNDEEGIFVLSEGIVYNVYNKESGECRDYGDWKATEVVVRHNHDSQFWRASLFGNHDGEAYFLTGSNVMFDKTPEPGFFSLHRLAGDNAELVQDAVLCYSDGMLNC